MKPIFDIRSFLLLCQLCLSTLAASITLPSNSADLIALNSSCGLDTANSRNDLPPDPSPQIVVRDFINGRFVDTTTSLIFKNFRSPIKRIDPARLFAVTDSAQYDIVKAVVAKHGDGAVTPYNFEWHHGSTFLLMNHRIDDGMTWSIMSRAVKGVTDWGWNVGFIATQFVVLDNMVEVGTGQLGIGYQTTAVNGASTA